MPQVYIDSLAIENFGPFYGRTEINFRPVEGRSGILIGGKNGAGKTHLLRALYLAVVGETGVHDLKDLDTGSDATRFHFENALNRRAALEGQDSIKLEISVTQRGEQGAGSKKLTLVREVTHRPNYKSWKSRVIKPDGTSDDDDDVIQKLRDSFLPRHLARFFFFDAERSQGIHLGDKDIVEGVSRILGLWTYGELEQDLRALIQAKIPRTFSSSSLGAEESKLADISSRVVQLQGHIKGRNDDLKDASESLKEAAEELNNVEEELRALGSIDPEELDRTRARREEIKASKEQMEAELRTAWELPLPVALLGSLRTELNDYLIREEKRNEWERSKATVEPKIPGIKAQVFDGVPQEFSLPEDQYCFYANRLERALASLFNPPPEGMADSVFVVDKSDVSAQVRSTLFAGGAAVKKLVELSIDVDRASAELRELDSKLKNFNQNSATIVQVAELRARRTTLNQRIQELTKRCKDLESEISQLEASLIEQKREEENQRQVVEKALQGRTLATLAASYKEAAEEIQRRAAIQMRNKVSDLVGDLWVDITERKREFSGMDFDKNWNCLLIRKDGKRVPWEESNTSAGQRQVRMLAFYEALRRLARLIPPLVVDTPLGRLDKEVRESVLERLYLTGHQSMILATNSEIDPDGRLFEKVQDRLARVYTLVPHGKSDSMHYEVEVQDNYFGVLL